MSGRPSKAGLLGPQVEGYRAWLTQRGYTPRTIKNMLADLGRVGRWASAAGLEAVQIDEAGMAASALPGAPPVSRGSRGRGGRRRCWAICGRPGSSPRRSGS